MKEHRAPGRRRFVPLAALVGVLTLTACDVTAPTAAQPGATPASGATTAGRPAAATSPAAAPSTSATSSTPSPAATTPPPSQAATPSQAAPPKECATPASAFVRKAPGPGKTVALTFDDGPAPADAKIAGVLAEYGVHATFFVTGEHSAVDPGTVKMLSDQGHLIADHSYDHTYPSHVVGGWTTSFLTAQLTKTNSVLSSVTGKSVCFFRPPGGYTTNVLAAAGGLAMTSVLWSVDSLDWKQPGRTSQAATEVIVANATKASGQAHPIVLLHSGKASHESDNAVSPNRSNTVAALPSIIRWYRAQGYTFVRMDGAH